MKNKNKDFGKLLNKIEHYINSYDFFPNKGKVNTYLLEMPALLSAYLDSFENNDDIKEFLRGYQKSRNYENKELEPGEVKQYTLIVMDFVIEKTKTYLENKGVKYENYENYEDPNLIRFFKLSGKIFDYIESPFFYKNKDFVDQNIPTLIEPLIEYLDMFQDKSDIKSYLDEWVDGQDAILGETIDGVRKSYKNRVYDAVIEVINRELEVNYNSKNSENSKNVENIELKAPVKDYSHISIINLHKQLDEAISTDPEEASRLTEEIAKRTPKK